MLSASPAPEGPLELAVLGSPIAHSQSPAMHAAAYETLGLDWSYGRHLVTEDTLARFLESRDAQWRGVSMTMPLKQAVLGLLDAADELVTVTGSANTLLFDGDRRLGWNTDVFGIIGALARIDVTRTQHSLVLGGGATAASAIAAAAQLGAHSVTVAIRTPARAERLRDGAEQQGVDLDIRSLDDIADVEADLVVSTLPNGASVDLRFDEGVTGGATLFDVGYHPWPTDVAALWLDRGGRVVHGLEMLVHQALMQVRIFVTGDPLATLPDEERVFGAMRSAVGLDG